MYRDTETLAMFLLTIIAIITIVCTIACLVGGFYGVILGFLYHSMDDLVLGVVCFIGAFIFSTPIAMVVLD